MLRTALLTGLVSLTLSVSAASANPTGEQRSLDELIPAPCLLYVSVDVPSMLKGLEASPLGDAWLESGLQGDWKKLKELAGAALAEGLAKEGFEPEDLGWLFNGEVAFAVGPVDVASAAGGGFAFPALTFLADAGDRTDELDDFLTKFVAMARDDDPVTEEVLHGVTLYTSGIEDYGSLASSGRPIEVPTTISFGRIGSAFMLCFDEATARQIVGLATGAESVPTLAEDTQYELIRERTRNPESMSYYLDVTLILDIARAFAPGDEEREVVDGFIDLLGVGELKGIGGGNSIRKDGVFSELFALDSGPKRGLLWDFMGKAGPTTPPAYLPAEVTAFQVMHMDFASLWDNVTKITEFVTGMDPTLPEDPMADAEGMLGFSPGDLLTSLEGEVTSFTMPVEVEGTEETDPFSMGFQGFDFVVRLREMETIQMALGKLQELVDQLSPDAWPFLTTEHAGRTVHILKPEAREDMPFEPAFTITDNLLMFTADEATLKGVVDGLGSDTSGVADSPGFRRAKAYLPAEASYFSYTSAEAVDGYMSQIELVSGMLDLMVPPDQAEGVQLVTGMVPKLRTLVDRFDAALAYAQVTPEGCSFRSGWLFAE
jgi:hypothetical protein